MPGVDPQLFRNIIGSVVTGSIRAADKQYAAGELQSDWCQLCGAARQTASHLFHQCPHYDGACKPFIEKLERIRNDVASTGAHLLAHFDILIASPAWRCCGICNESGSAIADRNDMAAKGLRPDVAIHESQLIGEIGNSMVT